MAAITASLISEGFKTKTLDADGVDIYGLRCALVYTTAAASQGDTYTFDMATFGGTAIIGVYTVVHSTANSVLAANAITTSVSGTTITFTIPSAGGNTLIRASKVYFK